jgi:hypothetical protein
LRNTKMSAVNQESYVGEAISFEGDRTAFIYVLYILYVLQSS